MSQPTSGPWRLQEDTKRGHLPDFARNAMGMLDTSLRHIGIRSDADGGDVVATVWNHHHHHECIANARLIAAAPEMLELLRAVCDAYDREELRGLDMDQINAARALLARIEGKE
jgi:hypothetical protein